MELKGSKTEQNLIKAFMGESEARTKYTIYGEKARIDGYQQKGAIFDETSDNEKEHAKIWFKILNKNHIGDTLNNLKEFKAKAVYHQNLFLILKCKKSLK